MSRQLDLRFADATRKMRAAGDDRSRTVALNSAKIIAASSGMTLDQAIRIFDGAQAPAALRPGGRHDGKAYL